MRLLLLLLLVIPFLTSEVTLGQQSAQEAADSLVRRDEELFPPLPQPPDSTYLREESKPPQGRLPRHPIPEFSYRYERKDLLSLVDRHPFIRYNRADGFYLGIGRDSPSRFFLTQRAQAFVSFGYGFGSHYWQVFGGLKRDFGDLETPFRLSAEGHIFTDTQDAWKMDAIENSVFAFFDGIDTRDYFKRSGFSVALEKFLNGRTELKGEFRRDNYAISIREVQFSVFGPKHPFREVPGIREGAINSVVVNFLTDYLTLRSWSDPQFGLQLQSEFGFGAYTFAQHVADARINFTIVHDGIWLGLRARAGSATGDAPPQKLFAIGGFGTLPGYPQNAYGGNRMLLLQSDLLFNPFPEVLGKARVIISNDFGFVGITDASSGLLGGFQATISQFKYSPGIYLGSPTGSFRIGAAWRTDIKESPTFIVRLSKPF